jgi:hypothetical protein
MGVGMRRREGRRVSGGGRASRASRRRATSQATQGVAAWRDVTAGA